MESNQSSSHDEESKQRGPTIKGKTTKGKIIVTYNKKGVPIGVEATKLASFEGMVARSMVPITYATWRDVEHEKKKKTCGNTFWKQVRKLKKCVDNIDIIIETGKDEDKIDRALLWKMVRQMKKGGYDPNVQIAVDKMEEMQNSTTLGEVSCGTNDMLTQPRNNVGVYEGWANLFNQLEGTIEKLRKGMNHASEGASCQGWDKADFEDNPPEELLDTFYYLAIDISSNLVAKGTIIKHNDLSGKGVGVYGKKRVNGDEVESNKGKKRQRELVEKEEEKGEGTPKTEKRKKRKRGKEKGHHKGKRKRIKEKGHRRRKKRNKRKRRKGKGHRRGKKERKGGGNTAKKDDESTNKDKAKS
ncbi:hypothetical protein F3Y22_tig00000452pilonHSYRG00035 [Hibiscus syriacus]|uniref:Uncharacterized protein n=1 Tax=Hibiscus syriacus TaxID=106335 RepID=A0A6A3D3H2_HIBSY|nr:hypothetical protein F3Y22_tig00000452pilonHSYRG00035 [Hibiscus syriacus]